MNLLLPKAIQACMLPTTLENYRALNMVTTTGATGYLLKEDRQRFLETTRTAFVPGKMFPAELPPAKPGKTYDHRYDSALIRGTDESRPWDLNAVIASQLTSASIVLDVGSGTGLKLPPLAASARWVVGLEPNPHMIARSLENLAAAKASNVTLFQGLCESLPFVADSFDAVTCMLAPHRTEEIHRVLKPGGVAILEKLGDRDKWDLVSRFGIDSMGPRSRFGHLKEGERAELIRQEFEDFFDEVNVQLASWTTYYTLEGLKLLCELTPTVRGYDPQKDAPVVENLGEELGTDRGIPLRQQRILVVARK